MTSPSLRLFLAQVFQDQALENALNQPDADPVAVAASVGCVIDEAEYRMSLGLWEQWRLSGVHDEEY